jgi:hypothetical protein
MIVNISATAGSKNLTPDGKKMIAQQMYHKGKGFIVAAILLKQKEIFDSVAIHLLLQGIENTLKGGLLLIDYNK